mmetsp:Transcript_8668/g.24686  ORF Transcript_8668/g.24686 Transcript_8668/m.24686 type:complete len:303 (-) Transcript_8668:497-1405(-)
MLAKYRGFGAFGAALVLLRACCPGRAESMPPCMERRCMIGRCLCLDQAFNSNCLDGARNPHAAAFLYALIDAVPKDRTARVEQICLISKSLRQTYEALHERDARNMTKLLEQVALVTDGYRALGHRVHRIGVTFYDVFMHLAREALLEMDACPSATPSRTLMWFVSSRDVDAALNVKLALAALEAESRGWGLRVVHNSQAKAVVDSVERALLVERTSLSEDPSRIRSFPILCLGRPGPGAGLLSTKIQTNAASAETVVSPSETLPLSQSTAFRLARRLRGLKLGPGNAGPCITTTTYILPSR